MANQSGPIAFEERPELVLQGYFWTLRPAPSWAKRFGWNNAWTWHITKDRDRTLCGRSVVGLVLAHGMSDNMVPHDVHVVGEECHTCFDVYARDPIAWDYQPGWTFNGRVHLSTDPQQRQIDA